MGKKGCGCWLPWAEGDGEGKSSWELKSVLCAGAARVGIVSVCSGGDFGFSLTCWCVVLSYIAVYRAFL